MNTFNIKFCTILIVLQLSTLGCTEYISYSIFDTDVKSQHYNAKNIEKVQTTPLQSDTLTFGFFSDSHDNYDELSAQISSINKRTDVQFVISGGDITNFGLVWEFEKYLDIIKSMKKPVITIIGNHDYVSNGQTIYKRMFGTTNLSFTYGKYKFVLFDDVMWENGNRPLNFEWLHGELENSSNYNIFISHLPFWDPQIDSISNQKFKETLSPNNTMLCLHGHTHNYKECEQFGIHTLVAGDLKDREYFIITLANEHFEIERIKY